MRKTKGFKYKPEKADEKGMIDANEMEFNLPKIKNAVCEINMPNSGLGSGFFCKIPYTDNKNLLIPALITCSHVIPKKLIEYYQNIILFIGNEFKIIPLKQRKIWINETIDYTCIEIKEEEDNIHTFLDLDDNIFNENYSNEYYLNQEVLLFAMNKLKNEKRLVFSNGKIKNNKNYDFTYTCNTYSGCSGGCIVNQNNYRVIGIHKGGMVKFALNVGVFIMDVIKDIIASKNSILPNVNYNNNFYYSW